MPTANEYDANEHSADEDARHAATQPGASDPVQSASDKLNAALRVLRGVQAFRYDHAHRALREAMRQTALAAIEDAITDLHEVRQVRQPVQK